MFELDCTIFLNVLNLILALALFAIYFENYRKIKSHFCIGLMLFALLFIIQNLVAVYYQSMMVEYYSHELANVALALMVFQTLALGTFLWITLRPS